MNPSMKVPVTAIVFTLNEENNISDCISSLNHFQEILVIDSGSLDSTLEICDDLNVRVVDFRWNGLYPKKRQWTLDNVVFSTQWVMFIDADERCTTKLNSEIGSFISKKSERFSAGEVKLNYYFSRRLLRHGIRIRKTVLLRPNKTFFGPIDDLEALGMGELEGHYQPIIHGKIYRFKNGLDHNDNDGIDSWSERHIRYARWEAFLLNDQIARLQVRKTKSGKGRYLKITRHRGVVFFLVSYFLCFGFLDGKPGFNFAFGRAWYYWLSSAIASERKVE